MIINEKIRKDPLLSLRIFGLRRRHNISNRWHFHKEIEILLVLEGWLEVHVEEKTYLLQAGDLLLIGSGELHRDRTARDSGLHYVVLQFDPEPYFGENLLPYLKIFAQTRSPLSQLNYLFNENETVKKNVFDAVLNILEEMEKKEAGYEIAVNMLIQSIMLTLLRNDSRRCLHGEMNPDLVRLKPVLEWIDTMGEQKLTVEEACRRANMSYYYFVKYFKQVIGMTFTEYVHYKRIKKAERILLTEDVSISEVGERIGMPNMAHFYKVFKKYNRCSPNEFRKKMRRWTS